METSTKKQIFATSIDLFSDYGYYNVSVRQIANKVGITSASIYNHYKSKNEILNAIFNYYNKKSKEYTPELKEVLRYVGKEPPIDTLKRTVVTYPQNIQERMMKILVIATNLNKTNDQSEQIITNLINNSERCDRALLKKMLDMDLIEPLDVDSFVIVHSQYQFCLPIRYSVGYPMASEDYINAIECLFSLVKTKTNFQLASLPKSL